MSHGYGHLWQAWWFARYSWKKGQRKVNMKSAYKWIHNSYFLLKILMEQQQFSSIVSKQDFFLLSQLFSGLDRSSEKLWGYQKSPHKKIRPFNWGTLVQSWNMQYKQNGEPTAHTWYTCDAETPVCPMSMQVTFCLEKPLKSWGQPLVACCRNCGNTSDAF